MVRGTGIRVERFAAALAAAALAAGCAGGGGQGNVLMPAGSGLSSFAGAGNTVVRIFVPSGSQLNSSSPAQPVSLAPTPAGNGGTPPPSPFPTAGAGTGAGAGAGPGTGPGGGGSPGTTTGQSTPAPPGGLPPLQSAARGSQLLAINVSGPTSFSQTVPIGPNSGGCTPTSGGSICQLALSLPAGTYFGTIGNAAIAFTVSSNASNALNLTLGGVPAQVAVVPANFLSATNAQGGIDLYGAGKHLLLVEMLDANQNVMVGGGASYTMSQAGGGLSVTVTQSPTGAQNLFYVTAASAPNTATALLRASASYAGPVNPCAQANAACSGSVRLDVRQVLAVANSNASSVTLYVGSQSAPLATIQNAVTSPQALIFDLGGDLFVANLVGSVTEYPPPYAQATVTTSGGINHPQALALDAHGNLFVANGNGSNTVTIYAPPYGGAPSATISADVNDPVGLALDANADLFIVNAASNTVAVFAPPYSNAPTVISKGLNAPGSLALDAHGNLFVANLNSTPNSIVEYAPPFSNSSAPVATISNGINEQGSIAVASSTLFVPNQGANTVTEYAAPYTSPPTTIVGGQSQPVALAVDALGNLYVANYGNNTVTEYSPPYAPGSWTTFSIGVSAPLAMALSPATIGGATVLP